MNPAQVKSNTYRKENNKEYPKFKFGDHVRMSKYKTIYFKELCFKVVRRSAPDYKS